jgi:membrane protease YdiL (CAAX protease family)
LPEDQTLFNLAASLLTLTLQGVILVMLIVSAVLHRSFFKSHWRSGLVIGAVAALLIVPLLIGQMITVEPSRAFETFAPDMPDQQHLVATVAFYAVMAGSIGFTVLKAGWWMVVFVAAAGAWAAVRPGRMAGLVPGQPMPWAEVTIGAVVGVAVAAVTGVVFMLLDVGLGSVLEKQAELFHPSADSMNPIMLVLMLMAVSGIALVEELIFRGALLGALLKWAGDQRVAAVGWVVLVSLVWAAMHLLNTDAPLIKMTQIFIMGLILAWLTWWSGLSSAIAAHVALNITAVLGETVLAGT